MSNTITLMDHCGCLETWWGGGGFVNVHNAQDLPLHYEHMCNGN